MSCNKCHAQQKPCSCPKPEPCHPCYSTPAPIVVCDPCSTPVQTPMTVCERVDLCSEGCEETLGCGCVIFKGAPLTAIDVSEGDTLCAVLTNLDSIIRELILGSTTLPTYTHRGCAANQLSPITLSVCKKNGISQIVSPVVYANGPSLLAFLLSVDSGWGLTAPNKFSIHSTDDWEISTTC